MDSRSQGLNGPLIHERHRKNQLRDPLRFIDLDIVLRAGQEEQVRRGEQIVKTLCDPSVQVGVGVSENDAHGSTKFPKPWNMFRTRADRSRQVLIQAEKGGTRAGCRIELTIKQRQIFISH